MMTTEHTNQPVSNTYNPTCVRSTVRSTVETKIVVTLSDRQLRDAIERYTGVPIPDGVPLIFSASYDPDCGDEDIDIDDLCSSGTLVSQIRKTSVDASYTIITTVDQSTNP